MPKNKARLNARDEGVPVREDAQTEGSAIFDPHAQQHPHQDTTPDRQQDPARRIGQHQGKGRPPLMKK